MRSHLRFAIVVAVALLSLIGPQRSITQAQSTPNKPATPAKNPPLLSASETGSQAVVKPEDRDPWIAVFSTKDNQRQFVPASSHPDGVNVRAIRCSGQHAAPIPGGTNSPVHSPEDTAAGIQFDVLPRAAGEAWYGLGYRLHQPNTANDCLGPVFGIQKGQFVLRQPAFGAISTAPLRPGDSTDNWFRLRMVVDFKAKSFSLQVRNLSKREKEFTTVIGPIEMEISRMPERARNPLMWDSQYMRGLTTGSKQSTELANLTAVASRGIAENQAPKRSGFPQDHPYQRELLRYMGTLTAADLNIEVQPFKVPTQTFTPTENYQFYLLNSLYASPDSRAMKIPGEHLTLAAMDQGDHVLIPGIPGKLRGRPDAVSYAWYASWKFPGNPYYGSKPLKLRAFVGNAVDMMMLDRSYDEGKNTRSDYLGGTMIWLCWGYLQCKDVLPPEVQAAYETGLRRMVDKLSKWGPTGLMTDMDLFVLVSMPMVCKVFPNDPAIEQTARDLTLNLVTNPRQFHAAGYFRDLGCFDVTYNGISLYMLTWGAALCDWPHLHQTLAKAYRLRSHMVLPEVGGGYFGPSHFSSRTSGDAAVDQWGWLQRNLPAAAMTDEALPALGMHENDGLNILGGPRQTNAAKELVGFLNRTQNAPSDVTQAPWLEAHWTSFPTYSTLLVNDALLERLTKLRDEKSPLLLPAAARPEFYLRDFGGVITANKTSRYASIIFTGPVGGDSGITFHGFGGGTLSAFGTATTGPLILGRRAGYQGPEKPDHYEEAPLWPVHAITASTSSGAYVSTARCRNPKVTSELSSSPATITVEGAIPSRKVQGQDLLTGSLTYTRRFALHEEKLAVTTTLTSDGKDALQDLYEVIPLFVGSPSGNKPLPTLLVQFERDGQWVALTHEAVDNVKKLRIQRHTGIVDLTLDAPARVQLSAQNWQDRYQTKVLCRNIYIHLPHPEKAQQPWTATVGWTLTPQQ